MAIADIPRVALGAPELVVDESDVDVRLDVHDASRLEWSVSIPLPERGRASYGIEVELEIPANVFAHHLPWDQLQSWTRLDGPAEAPHLGEAPSIDALRRGAIAFAHKLARASEGFARHCRLAGAISAATLTPESLEERLRLWVGFATRTAEEARERLARRGPHDSIEIARERKLVDEYVSVRLLEMLASAERAIAALREAPTPVPRAATYEPALARVEETIAGSLEREVARRDAERWLHPDPRSPASLESYIERASRLKKHFQEVLFLEPETFQVAEPWLHPDPRSPASLESYIERASRLKKHFQEVLFLEPETFQVAERLHNWVAALVAIIASTWAFAWQIALMNHRPTTGARVGSGIVVLAVILGLVYAVKDRIKDVGRRWISGNVHRFYAQRVARWRAPAKRLPRRDVVVRALESFDTRVVQHADALNPESGATTPATLVRYVHRGTLFAKQELVASGVRRVKHVFRYDLSPLFARLDDPIKQVPVLDVATRKVIFTAAPRCYRVPVRLHVTCEGASVDERATLVLHKRGLDRLEFARGGEAELETGVLPT